MITGKGESLAAAASHSASFEPWPLLPGVLELPDGRRVRGRGRSRPPADHVRPDQTYYLTGRRPPTPTWDAEWVRWPDFLLPMDWQGTRRLFERAHEQACSQRVEVVCHGGRGRTGTALACLTVLAGCPAGDAVRYVRAHYDPRAVETPWQRAFVHWFARH
jgi:hypothetical protein